MAAAVALSNYQLGDLLGRGASGSVYRALNFLTGETVAIKSVSLLTLSPTLLPDIMSEIDLLKNLNHPNIVKYKGFARDKENLFIVLEYCENGSLQSILKKFGKFPESLVAVYISQVLEGLIYLHEQGVIHRDIKGANILTNKDGSVKLADFGVSSRSTGAAGQGVLGGGGGDDEGNNEVVGSPYWMAPEVIEQSGASTASDIWSVGCVVVELLEGKPPYGDLAPMQALWRIVQDESMRIPEGASPIVKDFLYHCFQKDPNLRVTAKKLLRHPWMLSARKRLDSAGATQPAASLRAPSPTKSTTTTSRTTPGGSIRALPVPREQSRGEGMSAAAAVKTTSAQAGKKPMTAHDEAVQRVQEWNEALNASPKAIGTIRRFPSTSSAVRRPSIARPPQSTGASNLFALPSLPSRDRESSDSLATQAATSSGNPSPAGHLHPPPSGSQGGLLQKNLYVNNVLSRAREKEQGETWDDDFAADITLSKLGHRQEVSNSSEDQDQKTLRPIKSPSSMANGKPRPEPAKQAPPPSRTVSDGYVEDYSDLAIGEDDLAAKLKNLKLKSKVKRGILHPDDLRRLPLASTPASASNSATLIKAQQPTPPPLPQRSLSTPSRTANGHASPSLGPPASSPRPPTRSPPGSRQNSLRGPNKEPSENEKELGKYKEEEEDYDDIFDGASGPPTLDSRKSQSLQLTKRSNRSWHSNSDDGEAADPFAGMDDDFEGGADDLEAQLLRDKRATLCANVERNVEVISGDLTGKDVKEACDELLGVFAAGSDMGLEQHFVASHGMLAVLEALEGRISRDVAVRLLRLVNHVVEMDLEMLESFCLIGGIPVVIPYTSKKHSLETRLEASTFVQQLTRSALTLQMFISCRGLRILVELLDEDYLVNKSLILSSLEGIGSVFDLQSPTPRNDFCRMFVREGILDPLSTALLAILKDEKLPVGEDDTQSPSARAVGVLLLFCQVAQADGRVRDAFASRVIMIRLLKACEALPRKLLVTAIKAIKHLSTSPQLIEVLQNSNAMEVLVGLLGKSIKGSHANEICSHIFQTIYSMCRLSKIRQEEAASSGIISLLKRVITSKSPLKQFALPILCDLAHAGKVSRRLLWQNDGMKLYLDLLEDPYWRVSALDAMLAWMQDETARVEDVLLEKGSADCLVRAFVQSTGVSFEGIIDPLLKILRLSHSLTSRLSHPPFFHRLSESLSRSPKAVVKLNLLRLTRVVCESHPDRASLVARFDLARIVDRLAKQDGAVLVRELAKEIYPSLLFGNDTGMAAKAIEEGGVGGHAERADKVGDLRSGMDARMRGGAGGGGSTAQRNTSATMRRTASESVIAPPIPDAAAKGRADGDRSKHKRKISRSQLRDVQWQTDENGKLRSVRNTPSKSAIG